MEQMKIADIKAIFENTTVVELPEVCNKFREDERPGIQKLVDKYDKVYIKYTAEVARIEQMKEYEKKYDSYGFYFSIC